MHEQTKVNPARLSTVTDIERVLKSRGILNLEANRHEPHDSVFT
ncbi:hypothetical protein SAMN05444166_1280 [Singulisphaera sp. GP187]|nr:hypothetical protein [Singulisphaera sp. GP187]SIN85428.1 hypothetical protein SAMN05444166_1280 [Singulisphaera sp. GP187]